MKLSTRQFPSILLQLLLVTARVDALAINNGVPKPQFDFLVTTPNDNINGDNNIHIQPSKILQKLNHDFGMLEEARPPLPTADKSIPAALVSAGSSYTRLWTHHTWTVHAHPPHRRYLRHLRRWNQSTTARKIMPTVLGACLWSFAISSLTTIYRTTTEPIMTMTGSSSAFAMLGAPLALLLTLRANASMTRLTEGRLLLGKLILASRQLSNALKVYIFPHSPQAAALAVRHTALIGWILKAGLRNEGIQADQEVIEIMLGNNSTDSNWLLAQPKRTTALTARIRQICWIALQNSANQTNSSPLSQSTNSVLYLLEDKIATMEQVIGGAERLFSSTIPPTYSRHLSRVISLWILFMPLSLIAAGLKPMGVALASSVATYVMVGIDEVGMEIEEWFKLMPLQQLSAALHKDVKNLFCHEGMEMPRVDL